LGFSIDQIVAHAQIIGIPYHLSEQALEQAAFQGWYVPGFGELVEQSVGLANSEDAVGARF
jgi:hypothetical protein